MAEESEEFILPQGYVGIPLSALRNGARRKIALWLNLEGSVNDETGLINNYIGLAELAGFDYLEIRNFELQKNPTEQLLHDWTTRPELNPTIGNLRQFLLDIERVDVLTDVWGLLLSNCKTYLENQSRRPTDVAPIQDFTVSSGSQDTAPDQHVDETVIMTVDDVEQGTPTIYDAFVCYSPEGEDLQFVKEMIERLEGQFDLKLFVPWRDDLPGSSRDTVCAKLISTRCRRMVIVLSKQYLQSSSCEFQTKFAHSLSPGARSKRLVPILTQQCVIPQILRYVTLCDYTKIDLREWFWKRLAQALKAPLDPESYVAMQSESLQSVLLNTSGTVPLWSATSQSSTSSNQGHSPMITSPSSSFSSSSTSSLSSSPFSSSSSSSSSSMPAGSKLRSPISASSHPLSEGYASITNVSPTTGRRPPAPLPVGASPTRAQGSPNCPSPKVAKNKTGHFSPSYPPSAPPPLPPTTHRPKTNPNEYFL